MKRYAALIVLNVLLFIWIGAGFSGKKEQMSTPYRFTFVCPLTWDNVARGMGQADQELGTNTKCMGAKNLNTEKEARQLEKAMLSDVDGIITAGTGDLEKIREKIREASLQGIPVVLVDSDLPDTQRIGYIGTNHYEAGVLAGEEMLRALKGEKGNIGVIVSSLEDPNQKERVQGFEDAIAGTGGVEIAQVLECDSDKMKIRKLVGPMLEENPRINALYCADELPAEMLGDILIQEHSSMPVVVFGMSEQIYRYLREGKYQASIVEKSYEQGYQVVQYLKDYLSGRTGGQDTIYTQVEAAGPEFDFEAWEENQGDREVVWYY